MFTKKSISAIYIVVFAIVWVSCTNNQDNQQASLAAQQEAPSSDVITADEQASLTPQIVLDGLKEGNQRFVSDDLTPRDYTDQAAKTASGQYPEAIILSCVDSRVPVETIFDKGVGDIFVGRVAGNFVNEDMLGSMEFATEVAGSKLVVVMGHESCGAVKSAIDDVKLGNITAMLEKIKPAVEMTEDYQGEKTTANNGYVTEVVNNNVFHTIEQIREESPIIRELERNGDVLIVGAFYDLDTGKVTFLQ